MGVRVSFSNTSQVMKDVRREIKKKMQKGQVNVGVSDANSTEAAFVAEFGAPNVPPRPFITTAVNNNVQNYRELVVKNYPKVMDGKLKIDELMSLIGIDAVNDIQQYMMELKSPANSAVTVQIKGFNDPLITDDLTLYDAVTYKVIK
jgi:hypothetical protein